MAALSLFYSYAHEDQALRDQLEKHLHQLQRQGLISAWHDRKILPGGTWAHEIDTHLETASIIILLVSPDFLGSDYCYEIEMQRALERHERGEVRVVPIILRPCDWQHSPFKDLQCLPRDGKPVTQWPDQDEVLNTITQSLRRIIEQQQALARPPVALSPLNRQNRMRMLRRVRTIWIDGLLTQSLHHAAEIELHLQDRPDMLETPLRLQVQELDQAPRTLPDGTTIVEVYDRAEGELLILGEPGAGKTTLLLELARTLLERAENDERLRMPIVFNLSSWAEKRQSLRTWLVEELRTIYHVPRKIGKGWVDADQVLPLFDGLDEVAQDARSACVQQINDYYQSRLERGSSPIVVCCRSKEYATLSTRVMLQHAVSILPLTDEQIDAYLEQAGEQVKALKQALNEDAELHDLACQPLMLNIFTFAYQGATAAEVPTGATREELQHTIFAKYVQHMLKRRAQSRRWTSEQVIGWLAFLAKQMRRRKRTVFSVEGLQSSWLPKKWEFLYELCVALVVGLVGGLAFGLLFGLAGGLLFGLSFDLNIGLNFWVVSELSVGLIFCLYVGLDTEISPTESLAWSWKNAWLWLVLGLVGGLVLGLVGNLDRGLAGGLFFGVLLGLVGVLVTGPVGGLSRRQLPEHLSISPNESIYRSCRNGLLGGLFMGPVSALVSGLVFGLVGGPTLGLVSGLFVGLFSALFVTLTRGLEAFVKHFILRFFLSQRGDLPWDLVAFLDEAAQRLLLRKAGGSYVFVHRQLLDYFADLAGKDE